MSPIAASTEPSVWEGISSGRYASLSKPIEKSDNDDRDYRLIKLQNDLQVLLIHDKDTDKASAALDVHVGHLSDPKELQGLAHFCEHLLFMGTEKYPVENDYNQYLSEHSGHSNAFTGLENTNYYFEVGHEWLEGALDRFAQFFISPLFSDTCTERELRAVDSEHKKNLQSDNWRIFQLQKSLSNPNHPYCHFGTGNLQTLRDEPKELDLDIRQELLKFHDRYYSANIMRLCVLGRESLDELTEWVVEKFSNVRNKSIEPPSFDSHPLTSNELLRQIFVQPVKDVRSLDLTFPFPDQHPLFRVQPGRYLSHLIGHEGKGSVLSLLKKKGWANYLSVGTSHGGIGFEFFRVSIDLTEEGVTRYEDVIAIVFQYIKMLKHVGIQQNLFDEVRSLAALSFQFKEKSLPSQYVSRLAGVMQHGYPPEWTLSGPSLVREFDPKLIEENLDWLKEDNFVVTLASQKFPNGYKPDSKERWYRTDYTVVHVSDNLKKTLSNLTPHPALHLPGANDFIPQNFDVNKVEEIPKSLRPDLIQQTPKYRLWHKKDDTFWVPRANVWMLLRSPLAYATPANSVKTRLYIDLVKDALNEYAYDAEVAGLSYNIESQLEGALLALGGYNDKLSVLLERTVDMMKNYKVDNERFTLIKDQLRRSYKNFQLEAPYQHAMYYLSYLTQEKMWTNDEKLRELERIQPDDIQSFFPFLLGHLHIEALVHGNLFAEDAKKMMEIVDSVLHPNSLFPSQLINYRSLMLPPGGQYVYALDVSDPDNVNSSIEYYCQVGDSTNVPLRARLSLLAQIAQEPCFDQLRTKEQLGYLVFSGVRRQTGTMGMRFIIQSEKDTIYLENRIEDFLEKLTHIIETMNDTDYQSHVNSLIAKKLEKDKNLAQEGGKYWAHVHNGYYEFDQVETDVKELRRVSKESLLAFVNEYIHPSSPTRRKISVHLQSQRTPRKSPKKYDVESLHTCLTSQGVTGVTKEEIQNVIDREEDSTSLEKALLRYLVDEVKADEDTISKTMAALGNAMHLGSGGAHVTSLEVPGTASGAASPALSSTSRASTPRPERDNSVLPLGNSMIQDVVLFKSQMTLSAAASPVVDLQTLAKL